MKGVCKDRKWIIAGDCTYKKGRPCPGVCKRQLQRIKKRESLKHLKQ